MKAYNYDSSTIKVEMNNCLIIIKQGPIDTKGKSVTSIQIIPDSNAGEPINIRLGDSTNTKVITSKKKSNESKNSNI